MKTRTKTFIVTMLLIVTTAVINAQDKLETTISADVVSSYIWRGTKCGDASIQPTLGIGYKGLSLSAWGSVPFVTSSDLSEFDLTLSYGIAGFNIGVTDYWFSNGGNLQGKYFAYKSNFTNHMFEGNIGYDFGILALQWYTYFGGNDYNKANGKRAYSSYFEISAPFKLGGAEWQAAVGVSPFETALYGNDDFMVTNVSLTASKDISITPSFSIPLFAGIAANPATEDAYFFVGITLQP